MEAMELIKIGAGAVGGSMVQTVNARDLHAFLEVGKDFSNWIKDRISAYDFKENNDFVCSPISASKGRGGHNAVDYHLTLDMAKELSMVERNERGKEARRYFIECERRLKVGGQGAAIVGLGEIVAGEIARALGTLLPSMVRAELTRGTAIRNGRTAGEVWHEHNLPTVKNGPQWLANRLQEMGAASENGARGELGEKSARMFDHDKANACMRNGLRQRAERYIAERRGQGVLHLHRT